MYNLNLNASSRLGMVHSETTRKKIGETSKGRQTFLGKKHSQESKRKMSQSSKGHKAWNKGLAWSDEVREKISKAKMGGKAWNKGLTKETDERIKTYAEKLLGREGVKGRPPWNKGKKQTEATKRKISETSKLTKRLKDKKGRFIGIDYGDE